MHALSPAGGRGESRALRPLAVLRLQMPLLRLQQPRSRRDRRGGVARRAARRSRARGDADAGPTARLDLLRRRHAFADGARDGRGGAWCRRAPLGLRARYRDNARGQSLLGRGEQIPRAGRLSASTASRSGCRRSTTKRCASWVARTTSPRASPRSTPRRPRSQRVSIDLIYARADQTEAAWLAELDRALGFGTEHLSLYQLTIEPGTQFAALRRQGQAADARHRRARANLFEVTRTVTAAAGIPAYEISNHARPGAESRHNLDLLALPRLSRRRPRRARPTRRAGDGAAQETRELARRRSRATATASKARRRSIPPRSATEALLMGLAARRRRRSRSPFRSTWGWPSRR